MTNKQISHCLYISYFYMVIPLEMLIKINKIWPLKVNGYEVAFQMSKKKTAPAMPKPFEKIENYSLKKSPF